MTEHTKQQSWIRGVNLGGWLVMERYITPYQFAITECHLRGDFCWYPGQVNAPPTTDPDYKLCDVQKCKPILFPNVFLQEDYPLDEYHLWQTFGGRHNPSGREIAEAWLQYHLDNFITEDDIIEIKEAGVTHVRVPLPHWILDDILPPEVALPDDAIWIIGNRWQAFAKLVGWARKHGLQVWPDIHTSPGSQNGFDNSGQQLDPITCRGWSEDQRHVERSLATLHRVATTMREAGMQDVVTGLGLLNEPFRDCPRELYFDFMEKGLATVRQALGSDTYVYVSDLFSPQNFNDGHWWLDAAVHNRTFLDTHYYQVFAETERALSPRQHVAMVCQNEYHEDRLRALHPLQTYWTERHPDPSKPVMEHGVPSCCWRDGPHGNTKPSKGGVKRMVGEWSAAMDVLPVDRLYGMMMGIANKGVVPYLNRTLSPERQDFLRQYVRAQMVTYEAADKPFLAEAWFYWNFKMEGGAFAEWDFLRGIREGWIDAPLPPPTTPSVELFGTCYDILLNTSDDMSVIHESPRVEDLPPNTWLGPDFDDDVITSHGATLRAHPVPMNNGVHLTKIWNLAMPTLFVTGLVVLAWKALRREKRLRRRQSGQILKKQDTSLTVGTRSNSSSTTTLATMADYGSTQDQE